MNNGYRTLGRDKKIGNRTNFVVSQDKVYFIKGAKKPFLCFFIGKARLKHVKFLQFFWGA